MRAKIAFSLCVAALAALLPAQGHVTSTRGTVRLAAATCCTEQQRALCVRFHEIAECDNGTCVCTPP